MPGVFITGTDTGVGKTYVSAALLEAFKAQGLRAVGMKPVAAGCEQIGGEWVNEDVIRLRAASSVSAPHELMNPYLLREPMAPHIAAEREGRHIEIAPIVSACRELERRADLLVVEGVGGFCVPLNENEDTADLAVALGLPVLLVVGMRLGCLNHALLSEEAIRARGLHLVGWVANRIDPEMPAFDENIEALRLRLKAPCLGVLDWAPQAGAERSTINLVADMVLAFVAAKKAE